MAKQPSNHFKLQINLTKAYKDASGDAYIEGVASGPKVDLTGERMSASALQSMVASINQGIIELRDAHGVEWNADIGEVVELSLDDSLQMIYRAKLDLNLSAAQDLWYRMTKKGSKFGVSIGAEVIRAGWDYVEELGREVYTYFELKLFEISITRQAAYQESYAAVVAKSLSKKEEPMSKTDVVEKTDELEETVEQPVEQLEQDNTEPETVAAEDQSDATQSEQEPTQEPAEGEEAVEEESEEAAEQSDAESDESETESESEESAGEPADAEGDEPEAAEGEADDEEPEVEEQPEEAQPAGEPEAEAEAEAEVQKTIATLQTSLDATRAQVETLTKSLSEKEAELREAQTELAETAGQLETATEAMEETQKSLQETQKALDKYEGRKVYAYSKYSDIEDESNATKTKEQEARLKMQRAFAAAFTK